MLFNFSLFRQHALLLNNTCELIKQKKNNSEHLQQLEFSQF